MAAAILTFVPASDPDDRLSSSELVGKFSDLDLLAAARETSKIYNGLVLAKAVAFVQTRLRCSSLSELAKRMGISRPTIYREVNGSPVSDLQFNRKIRELAALLEEEAILL